ncbi:CPBP family intramembrane glutamic endopeptidase [Caecibacteroides pullorum]|uniref:CPBP family intramembrane metalloprotease n=1 Tax=Caecibacteroides pullorum TaxID=2725562 RepID=A0AA40ZRQ3_9BACT|nr:type II CAAX endopeptidase family protein [Caecibacteroides pullorum]MBM6856377.1 CPBP family intramembrane metalloprotease [Caecibacteroides pullorum]MBV8057384.1 CPBP family intramembrane metalloprotease [Caecibacteroides pullorum]
MEMKNKMLWKNIGRLVVDILLFYVIGTLITMFLCVPLFLIQKALGMEMQEGSLPSFFLERLLMLVGYLSAAILVLRWRKLPLSLLGMSLRGRGKDLLAGLGVAVLLYAVGFGTSLLMGTVEIASVQWIPRDLLGTLLFFLLVAVTEEVMLRGFVLGRMLSAGMNRFVALFLSSALFSAMHLFNPNFALLPFVNILLAGCLLGASFLYTRNLCFPVVLHWFWNWLQGPVLGYEVSGMDSGETLLTLRLTGSDLLTGGSFGFEGSLLCTVLLVVGTLAIVGYYERRGRKEA